MNEPKVTIGLYRHFKGAYYFVENIVRDAVDGKFKCQYYNVLHPEFGHFVRDVDEWFSVTTDKGAIVTRNDNFIGQMCRFEKVYDLDDGVANLTTEHLIRVLANRSDSPLQKLDIEGLSNKVFCTDYVVGDKHYQTDEYPKGISTVATFTTEEEAKNYYDTHSHLRSTGVFKRTFIEVD